MPKVDLLNINGEKEGEINLPSRIFSAPIKPLLMAQAVRVYLANQRHSHAKTKTRTEVNRTKAKWYRQKGTGRARHGSRSAPIFVGGGVAHGPTGEENYKLKLSQKMKRAALFSALTSKLKEGNILVVSGWEKIEPKTKKIIEILKKLKIRESKTRVLFVLSTPLEKVILAGRNIPNLIFGFANNLNTYEVLNSEKIIFLPESIRKLEEVFLRNES